MSLCLTAAGVTVALSVTRFMLVWTHSVERIEWREVWQVKSDRLVLAEARVKGSGAGMDPPPGSRLEDGFWRWHPRTSHPKLVLNDAGTGPSWRLCSEDLCVATTEIVPSRGRTLVLESCSADGVPLTAFRASNPEEPRSDE